MTDEDIVLVVQGRIDGKKIVAQHKDYCGQFWHDFAHGNWDFENYYYREATIGEKYKDWNNKTVVYEG